MAGADLQAALAAWQKVKPPFKLATCGWVLGPPQNRALFDQLLPPSSPLSCINRQVGWAPVEPGFAEVGPRPKWAIPWLEDDPGLTIPQLWVGRTRRDAADALAYGCTGLLGIHWRTRVLGPNVAALAAAGWDAEPSGTDATGRELPSDDFYRDWSRAMFGRATSDEIAAIFTQLDSGSDPAVKGQVAHLPRPAIWLAGPGGIRPDATPWSQVAPKYAFVDELAALRPRVQGAGKLERFDFWLHQFEYLRAVAHHNCVWAQFEAALAEARKAGPAEQRTLVETKALRLWREQLAQLGEVQRQLLQTVSTPGGLGNVANWQQHNLFRHRGGNKSLAKVPLIADSLDELTRLLGGSLPADAQLPQGYDGPPRIIVPTVRSILTVGDDLRLTVLLLGGPRQVELHYRLFGETAFRTKPAGHVARGCYRVSLPAAELTGDLEYYVSAAGDDTLVWPATAPALNQTVVQLDR